MSPHADPSPGRIAADHTVRNAGVVLVQRGLHVITAAVFAMLVPRLMGPTMFGQYMLLAAVAMWFAQLSGLGAMSLLTRAVPAFVASGDRVGLRKLVTNLLALRGLSGAAAGVLYTALAMLAFGVSDLPAVVLMAAGVACRSVANVCFALFLGLNQAAQWGAGDLLRRWLTLVFVVVGVPIAGLQGACAGFFAANVLVLGVGLVQARAFVVWRELDVSRRYLSPFLRIGTAFAAGNLLLALTHRSGEAIVRASGLDFTEVGFYGAAYAIYLTVAHAIWQVAVAFAPYLIGELHAGRPAVVARWLERLLAWVVIAAAPLVAGAIVFGADLVPLVLGAAYQPVASNLTPLMLALFPLAVGSVGRTAALVLDRPARAAVAAALELATFWLAGLALATPFGSFGVCLAVLPASVVYAAWIIWPARGDLRYGWRLPLTALAVAAVFLPVLWLPHPMPFRVAAFAAALMLDAWLLWRLRVVTVEEVAAWRRLLRRPAAVPPRGGS